MTADTELASLRATVARQKQRIEELVPFLAIWAAQYQRDYRLDGLHPAHYDFLKECGARMDDFKRATMEAPAHPEKAG